MKIAKRRKIKEWLVGKGIRFTNGIKRRMTYLKDLLVEFLILQIARLAG
jgi:hypothetical protein